MRVGDGANILPKNHDRAQQARFSSQCDDKGGSCTTRLMPGSPVGDAASVAFTIETIDKLDDLGPFSQLVGIATLNDRTLKPSVQLFIACAQHVIKAQTRVAV